MKWIPSEKCIKLTLQAQRIHVENGKFWLWKWNVYGKTFHFSSLYNSSVRRNMIENNLIEFVINLSLFPTLFSSFLSRSLSHFSLPFDISLSFYYLSICPFVLVFLFLTPPLSLNFSLSPYKCLAICDVTDSQHKLFLLIVMRAWVGPATFLRWADNRRMMHQCPTAFFEQYFSGIEFKIFFRDNLL